MSANLHTNPVRDPAGSFKRSIQKHIRSSLGRSWKEVSTNDLYQAAALATRDVMAAGMVKTRERQDKKDAKRLYYLSIEFLIGRCLASNLLNLGLFAECGKALESLGADLEDVRTEEPDPALGNGGLGRLAACFLDSLATLDLPGYGYGIHYEFGLFRQEIRGGYQHERPDQWLASSSPWLIERPAEAVIVPVYGSVEQGISRDGGHNPMWLNWKAIIGVPSDLPVVGYGGRTVNFLRLYAARSSSDFDMDVFSSGDYMNAVQEKISTETISKVLYPADDIPEGKELRLVQEYFLVACSIRDIVNRYLRHHEGFDDFSGKTAIQLNDTHPALAVVELMRVLVDERGIDWTRAWEITTATLGYTNHTLLPEALEKWSVGLLGYVLPRHLELIFEINRRFLEQVSLRWPGDPERLGRMSIIEEGEDKQIRMANLSIIGSHSVNGVSALHSDLLKSDLVPDFNEMWPEKFNNKTNGISPRRWLLQANTELADLITEQVGEGWITDLDRLQDLTPLAEDASFRERFLAIKRANKVGLAHTIRGTTGVVVDPDSCFDIHAKRIHEYKRQLLNALHIAHQYLALVEDGEEPAVPKTYVFAGKAAPGYWAAKQTIKLIHALADVINNDEAVRGLIRVVFVPDYRVSLAGRIIPAADLSEQISTAGMEASGTGNMKFALNGALTIGTLDGANIEIHEQVGAENIFIFGLKAHEIEKQRADGAYRPWDFYNGSERIRRVLDALAGDRFAPGEHGLFKWVFQTLLDHGDHYFNLADFESYRQAQQAAGQAFSDRTRWGKQAILNTARVGLFSSDRTIAEYAKEIWSLEKA